MYISQVLYIDRCQLYISTKTYPERSSYLSRIFWSVSKYYLSYLQDWQDLDGDFVVNQFYGVIGTRLAFGEGSRYEEVSRQWKSYQYGELDVRM